MTLSKPHRDAIARAVSQLRAAFEQEFLAQASGRFGLHERARDISTMSEPETDPLLPWVEPLEALSLNPSETEQRHELVGALRYLHGEGITGGEAVARLVREAAFTAMNRLLTVRVAEALDALPQVTAAGRRSTGYREAIHDLFPVLTVDDDEGFWMYVQVCGDELGASVPLLFDRRLPISAFVPSRSCVDATIEIVSRADLAEVWSEPEVLGWAYQFFNRDTERDEMRSASRAPRNARELAVRNQFFTPRYVVDWLVQNTLGRRLAAAGYAVDLPLLVGAIPGERPLALEDVSILDPAVGSGHFLLGCYDLLETAWASRGTPPDASAPKILAALHGIEIDPRAAQVAQAALILRARRAASRSALPAPMVVTARSLPPRSDASNGDTHALPDDAQALLQEVADTLSSAPVLGSLLKVDERLAAGLRRSHAAPRLSAGATSAQTLEAQVLASLRQAAADPDATPAQRMFAADAADALHFVALTRRRYDVILMNPPFGRPVPETLPYLRAAYGAASVDLYAAFVARAVELLATGGLAGAITSRTGFFQAAYEEWRKETIVPRITAILDLGLGVMEGALVEAAAYVFSRQADAGATITVRRLIESDDKEGGVYRGEGSEHTIDRKALGAVPTQPLAYWARPEILELFKRWPSLEGCGGHVRQGLITADDFRFVRLWWEIPEEAGWAPYPKGGPYTPFYVDIPCVVDWRRDGEELRSSSAARVQNTDFYFRPGITWTLRSASFGPQALPEGSITSMRSLGLFPIDANSAASILGWAQSTHVDGLVKLMLGWASRPEYKAGAVQRVPWPGEDERLAELALDGWQAVRNYFEHDERSRDFIGPDPGREDPATATAEALHPIQAAIDERVRDLYGLTEDPAPELVAAKLRLNLPPRVATPWLSFLLGCVFGRWSPERLADAATRRRRDPFAPFSASSPLARAEADLAPPVVLPDDRGHPQDIVVELEAVARTQDAWMDRFETELAEASGKSLREHLRGVFFSSHVRDYSLASRVAPVYWHLTVPSRDWGLWVYAPTLSRETLFEIVGLAREKRRRVQEQLASVRQQLHGSGKPGDRRSLEGLEALEAEIATFLEVAEEVAQSGWTPRLTDGLVLCAVPLERLFADQQWRDELAGHRDLLRRGGLPWTHIQDALFSPSRGS